jgi:hypothetical protein
MEAINGTETIAAADAEDKLAVHREGGRLN